MHFLTIKHMSHFMNLSGDSHITQDADTKSASNDQAPRKRLDPEARRGQLLEHAISAFAEAGIERAVHADVAKRAGVSTPTVFKYFPTREALVGAVLDRVEEMRIGVITLISEGGKYDSGYVAETLAVELKKLCKTQPDLMKVALGWSVAFSSVRDRYMKLETQELAMLQARLKWTSEDQSDARILLASVILYVRMHFDGSSQTARESYLKRLIEILTVAANQTAEGPGENLIQ